jgi:predicted nuclease of predicted toxin-antitoxin system
MTETGSEPAEPPRLLLDEMHAPVVAQQLRQRGYNVVAVAEEPSLRAMTDEEVFVWAAEQRRRIVTENVKDFRRLLARSGQMGLPVASVLFTSSRLFPRVRRNPGPLIAALDAWLTSDDAPRRVEEDWLRPAE